MNLFTSMPVDVEDLLHYARDHVLIIVASALGVFYAVSWLGDGWNRVNQTSTIKHLP